MPQAKLLDPYEFLESGANPNLGVMPAPAASGGSLLDPYEFLGVAPGARSDQSIPAPTGQYDWSYPKAVASGLALGFGPELQGVENYLSSGGPFGTHSLAEEQAMARSARNKFNEAHPILGPTAEIAGTLPTVVAGNALTPGLSALRASPQFWPRIAGEALAGAEAGALQTGVTNDGSLDPVAMGENALTGAGMGAAFGLGAGVLRATAPKVGAGVKDLVTGLESMGIKLRPSQVAMSETLRRADQFFASGANDSQLKDFTRAVAKTFGENTDTLDSKTMGAAWDRITGQMDNIAAQTVVTLDQPLVQGMGLISANLKGLPKAAQDQVREVVRDINRSFTNGSMHGTTYQRLTSKGGVLMNLAKDSHPTVKEAGGKLRELLDDAVERSSPPGTREAWSEARAQFKNLIAVQPLVEGNVSGIVDPKALHGQVKKVFSEYGWGRLPGGMDTLAEGGRLMPKAGLTGSAAPTERLPWYARPGAMLPAGIGLGAAEYYLFTQNPTLAATAAAAALGAAGLKTGVGAYMKSDFYRNALTGAVAAPGVYSTAAGAGLTGAINLLNSSETEE